MAGAWKGGGAGGMSTRQRLDHRGGEREGGDSAGAVREEIAGPIVTTRPGRYREIRARLRTEAFPKMDQHGVRRRPFL